MSDRRFKIVLDTNVIVAATRSARGASAAVLEMIRTDRLELQLSVALALEYEEVLKRHAGTLTTAQIDELVSFWCANARRTETAARAWPMLSDPDDEMVARLAIECGCEFLVTFNV